MDGVLRHARIGILIPLAVVELFQASLAYLTEERIQRTLIGDKTGA